MLELLRNGQLYPLDDGTYCYFLGDDGWGQAPLMRINSSGPQQHGETDYGFRLTRRMGSLKLGVEGTSLVDLYAKRAALMSLFGPSDVISLRWTLGSTVRQIDGHFYRGMTMPARARRGFYQETALTIRCPDPTFYDPVAYTRAFGLGGGSGSWAVPMSVPTGVGSATLSEFVGITYPGSWLTYPKIKITGPITNPKITNQTTGEVLDFTGTTITTGHYYVIDCRYGYKTVIEDGTTNRIDKLTEDSDLATFHIHHDSAIAPGGSNSLTVTGSSVTDATRVDLTYFVRYIGL